MTLTVTDMRFDKQAQALTSLSAGAQTLIKNIINESNDSNIATPGGTGDKQKFFNHGYEYDPKLNGRSKNGAGVEVHIYYMPSNKREYDDYAVIDKAVGMLSGRRRLAVRFESEKVTFYTVAHPEKKPGLPDNSYGVFTPIDTSR